MDVQGSVAIVTGGAAGIGAALCKSLLSRGVKVSFRNILWCVILICSFNNHILIAVDKVRPEKFIICFIFSASALVCYR